MGSGSPDSWWTCKHAKAQHAQQVAVVDRAAVHHSAKGLKHSCNLSSRFMEPREHFKKLAAERDKIEHEIELCTSRLSAFGVGMSGSLVDEEVGF